MTALILYLHILSESLRKTLSDTFPVVSESILHLLPIQSGYDTDSSNACFSFL